MSKIIPNQSERRYRCTSLAFLNMNGSNGTLPIKVGYTAGRGTGKELADVFERVIKNLSKTYSASVDLQRSSRIFHSYNSLVADFDNLRDIEHETAEDVRQYESFCRTQAAQGTRVTFKTAINAQSLYLVRQRLQAVKVESFTKGENALLLIRDESQGFYTGIIPDHYHQRNIKRAEKIQK